MRVRNETAQTNVDGEEDEEKSVPSANQFVRRGSQETWRNAQEKGI